MHQGLCVKLGKAFKVEYLNTESCRNTKGEQKASYIEEERSKMGAIASRQL